MYMPTPVFHNEDLPLDPDTLKMPESPGHRQACDLIGLATINVLGPSFDVFRDMNWYPADGGNAIAPDVMVLPAGVVRGQTSFGDELPRSYRQDVEGGPLPVVCIEIPSHRDTLVSLMTKLERCRRLGVMVYLVTTEGAPSVLRYHPEHDSPEAWDGRPIDELGGVRLHFVTDEGSDTAVLELQMPDGVRARADYELVAEAKQAASDAEQAANDAKQAEAKARAELEALQQQLRQRGIDFD